MAAWDYSFDRRAQGMVGECLYVQIHSSVVDDTKLFCGLEGTSALYSFIEICMLPKI